MDIDSLRNHCLSLGSDITEKMPFGAFAARFDSILGFYVVGHMFCVTDVDNFTAVTVKARPSTVEEIKLRYASAHKPSNFSERHWMQLDFGGDIPDSLIYQLIDESCAIVRALHSPKK